jgi:hypothetical protein
MELGSDQMTPDIDLATVPSDAGEALGYAELYALWKADEEAFDQGHHISDAEYLFWMARVRMQLTQEEKPAFDQASKHSIDEFRAEKSAALVEILRARHGLPVAKIKRRRRSAS